MVPVSWYFPPGRARRASRLREPLTVFALFFTSDAIPVHLVTAEALGIYLRHMKPGGVIAFHVTNRYVNLIPVVEALAHARGLNVINIADDPEESTASRSDWVLLSDSREWLDRPELAEFATEIVPRRDWRLWTDDFNNLVQVLK